MYKLARIILFFFEPEAGHNFVSGILKIYFKIPLKARAIRWFYEVKDKRLERNLFGLKFKNPVGLGAGFDKNARIFNELANFGFGFIEIGTVTPLPQAGNPKPRLFRLLNDMALINRMGFNNDGADKIAERLKQRRADIVIGANIGKNKTTPNEEAVKDYEICFQKLFPYVDYFTINVSSPNTPGLRELQEKEPLKKLLMHIQNLNNKKENPKPILLKIAPDLTERELDDIIEITKDTKLSGIVATNTTIKREGLSMSKMAIENLGPGGLSGEPLKEKSTEVIRYLRAKLPPDLPIIGVGGIMSHEDALEKLRAGASLVQIYTGFVYEGPGLVKRINKALLA